MYEVYIDIDPEVCPYCGKFEKVHFIDSWVDEDTFTEQYYCTNCSKEYYVDYNITNPRYKTS